MSSQTGPQGGDGEQPFFSSFFSFLFLPEFSHFQLLRNHRVDNVHRALGFVAMSNSKSG